MKLFLVYYISYILVHGARHKVPFYVASSILFVRITVFSRVAGWRSGDDAMVHC